mmetsp:Transcript_5042/g.15285  ORF Transcript_5042/g.15285 Transcript_5042/m.15285 type:complete len:599 (+) Transcript_5042:3185-4981(+)
MICKLTQDDLAVDNKKPLNFLLCPPKVAVVILLELLERPDDTIQRHCGGPLGICNHIPDLDGDSHNLDQSVKIRLVIFCWLFQLVNCSTGSDGDEDHVRKRFDEQLLDVAGVNSQRRPFIPITPFHDTSTRFTGTGGASPSCEGNPTLCEIILIRVNLDAGCKNWDICVILHCGHQLKGGFKEVFVVHGEVFKHVVGQKFRVRPNVFTESDLQLVRVSIPKVWSEEARSGVVLRELLELHPEVFLSLVLPLVRADVLHLLLGLQPVCESHVEVHLGIRRTLFLQILNGPVPNSDRSVGRHLGSKDAVQRGGLHLGLELLEEGHVQKLLPVHLVKRRHRLELRQYQVAAKVYRGHWVAAARARELGGGHLADHHVVREGRLPLLDPDCVVDLPADHGLRIQRAEELPVARLGLLQEVSPKLRVQHDHDVFVAQPGEVGDLPPRAGPDAGHVPPAGLVDLRLGPRVVRIHDAAEVNLVVQLEGLQSHRGAVTVLDREASQDPQPLASRVAGGLEGLLLVHDIVDRSICPALAHEFDVLFGPLRPAATAPAHRASVLRFQLCRGHGRLPLSRRLRRLGHRVRGASSLLHRQRRSHREARTL